MNIITSDLCASILYMNLESIYFFWNDRIAQYVPRTCDRWGCYLVKGGRAGGGGGGGGVTIRQAWP